MKHYSADLLSNNEVVTDGRLLIAEGRAKIVAVDGTAIALSDAIDGLVINTTNNNFVLDAQGSEFDPNIGTIASAGVIDLIRDIEFDTTTNMLHFSYQSDYDTAASMGEAAFSISLASLAGGGSGSGASTNPTNHDLPVKQDQGVVSAFVDAPILVETTNYASHSGLTFTLNSATQVTLSGGTDLNNAETGFAASDAVVINQIDSTTGLLESANGTVSSVSATDVVITIGAGDGDGFEAAVEAGVYKAGTQGDVVIQNNLQINGNLQVHGDRTEVNQSHLNVNDSFVVLNHVTLSDSTPAAANLDGGIIITKDIAAGTPATATYAGLRFDTTEGPDGTWQVATSLNADDGSDGSGTWKNLVCEPAPVADTVTPASVFKVAGVFPAVNQAASETLLGITVTAGTGTTTWAITHNLGNAELVVNVYDSNNRMILPDEITVTGSTVEIQMPGAAADFATTDQHRFVIIG